MQKRESVMNKIILMCLALMLFACDTITRKTVLDKINKVEQIDYNSFSNYEDCISAGGTWTDAVEGYGTEAEELYVEPIEASCSDPSDLFNQ